MLCCDVLCVCSYILNGAGQLPPYPVRVACGHMGDPQLRLGAEGEEGMGARAHALLAGGKVGRVCGEGSGEEGGRGEGRGGFELHHHRSVQLLQYPNKALQKHTTHIFRFNHNHPAPLPHPLSFTPFPAPIFLPDPTLLPSAHTLCEPAQHTPPRYTAPLFPPFPSLPLPPPAPQPCPVQWVCTTTSRAQNPAWTPPRWWAGAP